MTIYEIILDTIMSIGPLVAVVFISVYFSKQYTDRALDQFAESISSPPSDNPTSSSHYAASAPDGVAGGEDNLTTTKD